MFWVFQLSLDESIQVLYGNYALKHYMITIKSFWGLYFKQNKQLPESNLLTETALL